MAQATVATPEAAAPAAKRSKKLLFIVIGVVVLAAAGGGAALFMSKDKAAAKAPPKEAVRAAALYLAMDPPFVVNFQAEEAVRYLQVTVQLMTREQETLDFLKSHDPIIRNDLLMLFGSQLYPTISSVQGKEDLRGKALDTVRKAVAAEGGKPDKVEAVYFTSFVIQ